MSAFITMTFWAAIVVQPPIDPWDDFASQRYLETYRYEGRGLAPSRGSSGQRRLLALRAAEIDAVRTMTRRCGTRPDGRSLPFRIVGRELTTHGSARVVIESTGCASQRCALNAGRRSPHGVCTKTPSSTIDDRFLQDSSKK